MSFTFRSLFNRGSSSDGTDTAEASSLFASVAEPAPEAIASMPSPHPNPFAPAPGGSPPMPLGGALFRTIGNETLSGTPVGEGIQRSPFSSGGTGPVLTVGDILPQLPPDLAKASSLAPDHPVSISPQVLNAVLSSGRRLYPCLRFIEFARRFFRCLYRPMTDEWSRSRYQSCRQCWRWLVDLPGGRRPLRRCRSRRRAHLP
jgi:hypothetical protein